MADAERLEQARREAYAEAELFRLPENWQEGREPAEGIAIDAPGSLDRDDAILYEPRQEGGVWMWVTMPDVSTVAANSAMFHYAMMLAETRYLAGGNNVPMLPQRISDNLLSLLGTKETPSVTIAMGLDNNLDLETCDIRQTRIRPCCTTYDEVGKLVQGQGDDESVETFRSYEALATSLLARRRAKGALAYFNQAKGLMTNEEGKLIRIPTGKSYAGHLIVQEFMIQANAALGFYMKYNNITGAFRNHHSPQPINVAQIIARLEQGHAFHAPIGRAIWETVPRGHMALNVDAYAQGTSPMRRSGDMINIMQVVAHKNGDDYPFSEQFLHDHTKHATTVNWRLREGKNEFHKGRREAYYKRKLGERAMALVALKPGDFAKVVRMAMEEEAVPPEVVAALEQRMYDGTAKPAEIIAALCTPSDNEHVMHFKRQLIAWLTTEPDMTAQVVHNAMQTGHIGLEYTEVGDTGTEAKITWQGIDYIASADAGRRKMSEKRAVITALANMVDADVPEFEPVVAPTSTQLEPRADIIPEARGQLQALCLRRGWEVPHFPTRVVESDGTHYIYETIITINETSYTGQGTTKKEAQAAAASEALRQVRK